MKTGKERKEQEKKLRAMFDKKLHRSTALVSMQPLMPQRYETRILTRGSWTPNTTNNNDEFLLISNDLLTSTWTGSVNTQSLMLSNIGRSYSKYRVCAYSIRFTFVSRSTSDYYVWIVHEPSDPNISLVSSWQSVTTFASPRSSMYVVPANTKSPCVIKTPKMTYKLLDIIGDPEYLNDTNYTGTLTSSGVPTSPTDVTYCGVYNALTSAAAQTANNGPLTQYEVEQFVEFFDVRNT